MTRHSLGVGVVLLTALALAACEAAPRARPVKMGPVDEGKGTLTSARQYLEGMWSLESFQLFPPGRPPVTLKGSGALVYDKYSNLKMEIRPDKASVDMLREAGVEIGDSGTISTQGRTAVDLQNRTLTYVLEGQPPGTGPLALNRPRYWQVEGNLLTLTTKDDSGNPASVGRWRKSSGAQN